MLLALLLALAQTTSDRAALTQGVTTIVAPGALPGALAVSQPAFVILHTGDAPTIAAGPVGAGRAILLGHGSFFNDGPLKNPSNVHLFYNSISWASRHPLKGLKIALLEGYSLADAAHAVGADVVQVDRKTLSQNLVGVDVLIMGQQALDGDEPAQEAVIRWTKQGHGLIVAGPGWGWQQLNPNKDLRTYQSGNRMLLPFGLGQSGETAAGDPTTEGAEDPLLLVNPALAALEKGGLSPKEIARATATVLRALNLSSLTDSTLIAEVEKRAKEEGIDKKWPITKAMPFSRLQMAVSFRKWQESAPGKVLPDPSAAEFPGAVPPEAKRITRVVEVDTKVPRWHGLGLYAAPGDEITVTLLDRSTPKGLCVRIGSHTDTLWGNDDWNRAPEITREWPLNDAETTVASPFGGAVFITVPDNCNLGKVLVKVKGAIAAPRYVRGTTTLKDWAKMLAETSAPWAELEAHGIILSVPRAAVANLTDPEPLMAYWDEVADLCYSLYGTPRRPYAERYCVDRQISAGYMHNGYPIMTFEDVATTFTDVNKLRGKDCPWGFYHELGHNFQESAWTFPGTGEVTNNIFSLYGCEHFNHQPHPNGLTPEDQQKRLEKYLKDGARFTDWQNDPFLALGMYSQLIDAFGWSPFTQVFNQYRQLHLNPQTELAQHDEWMIRMSNAVHRNLAPFFKAWGIPTTPTAENSLKDLPTWMPPTWPQQP